jgi:hypothetical protein
MRARTAPKPDPAPDEELIAALASNLAALDEKYRLPISLCYEQDMLQREAAAVLGIPERTVSQRINDGLRLLRQALTGAGHGVAPAAILAALRNTAPPVPTSLTAALEKLATGGPGATSPSAAAHSAVTSSASQGGLLMKIGLGIAAAGMIAGTTLWAVGSRAGDAPAPASPPAAGAAAEAVPDINPFNFPNFIDTPGGRVEHVAGTSCYGFNGGYSFEGPARQAGVGVYQAGCAIDADGNLYIPDCQSNRIFAIIDGRWSALAGTGARGFRDDCPAGRAHFNLGTYTFHQACVTGLPARGEGAVYVADNDRVRRIFLKDGRWWAKTVAGGGGKSLKQGEKAPALSIAINTYENSVGTDRTQPDTIWVRDQGGLGKENGLIRITPDGMAEKIKTPPDMLGCAIQTDTQGRIYGWRREAPFKRLDPKTGNMEILAMDNPSKEICDEMKAKYGSSLPPYFWDGPKDKSQFYCPFAMLVAWDGSRVYSGGGDEANLRRIKDGMVTTLFGDGKFYVCQEVKKGQVPGFAPGTPMAIDKSGAVYSRTNPGAGGGCMIRYVPGPGAE